MIVYSSKTLVEDRASPILAIVYASLVLGHFLVPIARRTPVLYGGILIVGIVSTVFYALGIVPVPGIALHGLLYIYLILAADGVVWMVSWISPCSADIFHLLPTRSLRLTPFSLPLCFMIYASFALRAHSHTTDNRHRPRRMRLPSPNRQTPRPAHPNPPLRSKTPLPRRPVVELQGRRGGMVVESHCHVSLLNPSPQTQTND